MRLVTFLLAASQLFAASAFAETGTLSGSALKKVVAGKTVHLTYSGTTVPIRYSTNGTMSGRLSGFIAAAAGEEKPADRGKWWVSGDRLCQRWNSWLDKKSLCFKITMNGSNTVTWISNDGRSGTARIG